MQSAARLLFATARIIAGIALAAMVFIITLEIIVRNLFGPSLQLADEVGGYLLVTAAFFAMADAYSANSMMRIEFLYERTRGAARLGLDLIYDLVALAATLILVWFSARFTLSSWTRGTYASTYLETPQWLPQLAIPAGLSVLAIAIILSASATARQLLRRH
jgi:TRAP-type C4-dicarboxylate transport system permease small subunit